MDEMKKIGDLSPEDYTDLLKGFFAPKEERKQMTDAEIKDLAQRLNELINVPIINETKEEKIFIKIIIKVDSFLYNNLPNEFYDLVRSVDKGIDDEEAKRLIKSLSKLANTHIDIPYVPEQAEYIAIRFVIGTIINAARKNWDFDQAKEKVQKMDISGKKKMKANELEAMIAA